MPEAWSLHVKKTLERRSIDDEEQQHFVARQMPETLPLLLLPRLPSRPLSLIHPIPQ